MPGVTNLGNQMFTGCPMLSNVMIGTAFKTETEIVFGDDTFEGLEFPSITPNIDLILGEFVLPLPDIINSS